MEAFLDQYLGVILGCVVLAFWAWAILCVIVYNFKRVEKEQPFKTRENAVRGCEARLLRIENQTGLTRLELLHLSEVTSRPSPILDEVREIYHLMHGLGRLDVR